jgi:hypothetical protein
VTDPQRHHVENLIATHGPDWPAAWLDERGHGAWARVLRAHLMKEGGPIDDPSLSVATLG